MNPDDQPTIPSGPPSRSRPFASRMWQAPSVEEMQAMLPQYEILEILGRGGMGAVYKGRQKSLKRLVAIKILPPDAADDEMRFVERFENEAQTMAAMNHPAIVAVYDFGETAEGLLYFIMEFVDGTDVHKMIQASGKLGDDYALAITAHVCDALDYAHSRGVIHRDIKPANILIDQEGRVKVADFGLAKMHDPSMTSGLTKTNMAMGTPDYVAPEALSMGMVVDHRADLYAVGVMLYQMLTGEVPRGMFRMPSEKGIGTDPRFDDIICRAMEADRDHRYQTASEVRHSLDVILTTPQPKNDGTGVVPVEQIPKKVVLNVPGGRVGQSAGTPAGGTIAGGTIARSQGAPPKKAPAKKAPGKAVAARNSPNSSGKSSTGLWLTVVGVVAAIAVTAFFLMGGKSKSAAGPAPSSASTVAAKPKEKAAMAPTPRPSAPPGGPSNAPPSATTGRTIDLLALVDVKRDTIAGDWALTANGLAKQGPGTTDKGAVRLQLPYQPPEEYDFEVEFTAVADKQTVGQILSTRSRVFSWILAGNTTEAPTSGFEMFDGGATSKLSELAVPMARNLEKARRYVTRVEVRKAGLRGFLDGVELVNWSGDFKRLAPAPDSKLRDDKHLGLRAARDAVFHKITVREITGTGKVDAGVNATKSAGSAGATATWTDWLTPRLARGQFKESGYVVEKDGITTDQNIIGIDLRADNVVEGAIRLTYLLRDSKGAKIAFRNRGGEVELYVAEDSGSELSIARVGEGNKKTMLVSEQSPATLSRTGERTLEFRVTGGSLKATVNGTFSVSAHDPALTTGPGSFVSFMISKGLLLKKVEIADGKETVGGAKTVAKLDEDFIRAVAAAPPEKQVSLVTAKLNELNGTQANLVPTIIGGKVKFLRVEKKGGAPPSLDISPLAALKDLTDLRIMYVGPADISCLGGLPLERLEIHGGSFEDISALKSMPLKFLALLNLPQSSQEALDFTILRGMKLVMLRLSGKQLVDISFIKGMPLNELSLTQSGVKDFSPIAGMPLVNLEFDPEAKPDMALLRSITTLKTINKRSAAEYLKTPDGATATWTDWLTPKLASGVFDSGQWKREPGGFTTDQSLAGYEVLPAVTRDGAVRVTFALRESEGVMINIRETKVGTGRQQYLAQYTGTSLYIALGTDRLITEPMPEELRDLPEHTLEFRFEGENLIAILNDTQRISTRHAELTEGNCSLVLTKGVLVKKIEVEALSPP